MATNSQITHQGNGSSLGDILERVLDKGIVIAGDIKISLADVDLLNIKIRLVVCSVDKAMEMGINWWQNDPSLSIGAQSTPLLDQMENQAALFTSRLEQIESKLSMLPSAANQSSITNKI